MQLLQASRHVAGMQVPLRQAGCCSPSLTAPAPLPPGVRWQQCSRTAPPCAPPSRSTSSMLRATCAWLEGEQAPRRRAVGTRPGRCRSARSVQQGAGGRKGLQKGRHTPSNTGRSRDFRMAHGAGLRTLCSHQSCSRLLPCWCAQATAAWLSPTIALQAAAHGSLPILATFRLLCPTALHGGPLPPCDLLPEAWTHTPPPQPAACAH